MFNFTIHISFHFVKPAKQEYIKSTQMHWKIAIINTTVKLSKRITLYNRNTMVHCNFFTIRILWHLTLSPVAILMYNSKCYHPVAMSSLSRNNWVIRCDSSTERKAESQWLLAVTPSNFQYLSTCDFLQQQPYNF